MKISTAIATSSFLFLFRITFAAADPGAFKSPGQLNTCTARHECSFVQAGENFYLMGGRETNQIEQYNFASKMWTGKATAPLAIHHFQATSYGGLIWAVCAMTGGYPREPSLTNVYMYDPLQNKWFTGDSVPVNRRRGGSGVVMYNGEFYVVSGNTLGHCCGGVLWTDKYNPATNTWTILKDGPRRRDHFHATLYQGKIYAIGGRHSSNDDGGKLTCDEKVGTFENTRKEVDIYDIANNTWTTLNNGFMDRAAPMVGILGNEIVALGGETANNNGISLYTGQAMDLTNLTWRALTGLQPKGQGDAQGRHATQAIVSNGVMWAAAGSNSGGGSPINSFFGYYTDNANAGNLPSGTPIVAGAFSMNTDRLGFKDSGNVIDKRTLVLNYTTGNQGILISNIKINLPAFTLSNKNGFPWFLAPNTSMNIEVTYDPKLYTAPAQMTISTVVPSAMTYTVSLDKGNPTTIIQPKRFAKSNQFGQEIAVDEVNLNGQLIPRDGKKNDGKMKRSQSAAAKGFKLIEVKK